MSFPAFIYIYGCSLRMSCHICECFLEYAEHYRGFFPVKVYVFKLRFKIALNSSSILKFLGLPFDCGNDSKIQINGAQL